MENPTLQNDETAGAKAAAASEPIFALDIGTRSIIGVVGVRENEMFKVLSIERMEHPQRAMVDGQIEDIDKVSKVADTVKSRLEERLGLSLTNVYVAAAGRSLKTQKASYETALNAQEPISEQQVLDLEMSAIQEARRAVDAEKDNEMELYCVGHSVIRYTLDDYQISTLLNHRGKRVGVEVIATFLPSEVVESLYTAMAKIGLTVSGITLEPIAAMNAIIPKELRMLNLALVDIGAGTSDIAISNAGSVTAYTMATVAGDEITEAIVRGYLVDFETAERIKLELSGQSEFIEYKDILGFTYRIPPAEIMEKIQGAVDSLCGVISEKILEVNEKAPAAVFLVGGGSQFPTLCRQIAAKLSIEDNKTAVGGNNYLKRMVLSEQDIGNPEFATPMGIAITAMETREHGSFSVLLNGNQVRLFRNGPLTVMDILLMNGYRHNQMIGRAGKSVTFQLNDQKKTIRGGFPIAALLEVNGKPASISTAVNAGDAIKMVDARHGEDACPTVRDIVEPWNRFEILLNGSSIQAGTMVLINGIPADADQKINNMDTIHTYTLEKLEDLSREAKLDFDKFLFFVNSVQQKREYLLQPNDDIRYFASSDAGAEAVLPEPSKTEPQTESADLAGAEEAESCVEADASAEIQPIRVIVNNNEMELYPKEDRTPYLFVDMLNFIDIDPSKPQGNIVLRINGREASYIEPVRDQDRVEIYWDQQR